MSYIRLVFLVTFVAASLIAIIQLSDAFQSAATEQQRTNVENQQHPAPEPYSFSYTAESNGGLSKHEESGDGSGRVTGFYTIMGDDGRERRVDYIADADGYRAQISTNEVGTRAQSSANADYQVQLPSAGQLEAAKISYEQYKYLEDTHATERQRVYASHKQGHSSQQSSTADFNRQQQAQFQPQPQQAQFQPQPQPQQQPQFIAGQTSSNFQRGSLGGQFQGGQQAAIRPVATTSDFVNNINQGTNSAAISTSIGTLDDQNDLDWRKAKLLDNRNRTVAKFGSATEFSSASPASTLTQEAPLNNNQQQLSNQANRQYYSASSGGGRDLQAGLSNNADQGRQSNYERFQSQQQVQQKQKPSNFSGSTSYQQGQNYLGSTNAGRAPEFNKNSVLQGQLEQQFLIQASGDQDYMRQTNSPLQQTAVTLIPDNQISRFQATNAQAIGGQQRDENMFVTEERPTIPLVVPQIVTSIATTEQPQQPQQQQQQQQQQQVPSWNQQAGRGSSYTGTGNERDYQQVTASQQQQGDNNALVNDSNQFNGAYQEQTNILNNANQAEEKNELQQDLQQGGQIDLQDIRNQQQTLVSNQQGVNTVQPVTSRPTPSGLISINLSGNQEQEEVGTERPADKQQQITGNQNFLTNTQTQSIPQQQQQFTTIQYQQPVKTATIAQQFTKDQNQVQPIFRQNFSQTGVVDENNRPNSINQIIENITRQPIVQVDSEANQFGRQEGRFEQEQEQQQQGFKGAARPLTTLMRTETAKATTTTTTDEGVEPISEVSITTTNVPLFSRQEVQQETTTERVTYYQPTTAPITTSTSTTTTARPSTTTTTTTTTTPAPRVEITRQTLAPTQRLTETTASFLRPVQQQQQVVVQAGIKSGRKKAPSPLMFNRQNFNRTNEFSYNQVALNAPSIEPERVSYVTITTRAPLRTTTTTSKQVNNLQRVEQQAPYLSSISSQTSANLDSNERPFTRYTNTTKGEARSKTQPQLQLQPQQQIQQFQPIQQVQQVQQQQQQLPQIQIQPQTNTSYAQVSTVSQFPNEATYVTTKPIQQAKAQIQIQIPIQSEAKQQQLKGGIKGGSSSANKRQFWQQRTVPTANQELMRAMRSLTSSVSYVDQAQENKQSKQQLVSTRKATSTSTSAEDYDNLRSFGYRFEAVTQSS